MKMMRISYHTPMYSRFFHLYDGNLCPLSHLPARIPCKDGLYLLEYLIPGDGWTPPWKWCLEIINGVSYEYFNDKELCLPPAPMETFLVEVLK